MTSDTLRYGGRILIAQEIELSYTFGNFGYNMQTFVSAAVFYKQCWPCIQKASSILSHTFDQLQFTKDNIVLRLRIEYVFLKFQRRRKIAYQRM